MVQLQKDLPEYSKAGIQIVAISYDAPETLKAFAEKSKIDFPLLSDKGSKTIDSFGVRNNEQKGFGEGIPHPGTFLIDTKGIIRAKLFHEGYKERHSKEELLKAVQSLKEK